MLVLIYMLLFQGDVPRPPFVEVEFIVLCHEDELQLICWSVRLQASLGALLR